MWSDRKREAMREGSVMTVSGGFEGVAIRSVASESIFTEPDRLPVGRIAMAMDTRAPQQSQGR
jgi:hypothetical protein